MARLIRFWKPWGVLSQFTDARGRATLRDFIDVPGVYAAGRLDLDSEGLLLLTDSGPLQARIASPRFRMTKTYLAFVEQPPDAAALAQLCREVMLNDGPARALGARRIPSPELPAREPPPAPRPGRATGWVELQLDEGRNRQVRRMLAAVGSPVLRLVRTAIGPWTLDGLAPGEHAAETLHAPLSDGPRQGRREPGRPQPGRPQPGRPQHPDQDRSRPRPPDDRPRGTRSSVPRSRKAPSSRTRRGS